MTSQLHSLDNNTTIDGHLGYTTHVSPYINSNPCHAFTDAFSMVEAVDFVIFSRCPSIVVLLSRLWSCDVMIVALFSTHRRVPVLTSTRVYVLSLTSPRSLESVRPLAPYSTSKMKNSKSGYTRTSTILVPKQMTVYPGIRTNLYQKMTLCKFLRLPS